MAAPYNRNGGRPTKYNTTMLTKARKFLEDEERPTAEQLAIKLKVRRHTVADWGKKHELFSTVLEEIRSKYELNISEGALTGEFNATFAKFLLSAKLGLREKTDVKQEVTGDIGLNISFNTVAQSEYKPSE